MLAGSWRTGGGGGGGGWGGGGGGGCPGYLNRGGGEGRVLTGYHRGVSMYGRRAYPTN